MTGIAERPDLRAELLRRRLQGTAQSHRPSGITRVPRDAAVPLSFAQRQLWILDQIRPGTTEYLMTSALGLRGPLNVAALRQALDQTVAQHEILRTRYQIVDGEPVQVIDAPMPVRLVETDLTALDAAGCRRRLEELTSSDREPVDLATGPVISAVLARLAEDHHALLVTIHHIASDGWSEDLLMSEIGRRYGAVLAGRPEQVDDQALQYADYAAWQRAELTETKLGTLGKYWREQLHALQPLELPTDRPRPPVRDAAGADLSFVVPAAAAQAVRKLAQEHGATPFMAVLAVLKILLSRYAGQTDIAVGTPIAGRDRTETQNLLGILLNTVVLRTDLSGNPTFAELLRRVRETALAGYAHQEMPFTYLLDELALEQNPAQTPLFSVMFLWQDGNGSLPEFANLASEPLPVAESTAKFDLTVSLAQRADGTLVGGLSYASALFDEATMARFSSALVRLITAVGSAPDAPVDELDMLGEADRHEIVHAWNDTGVDYPNTTLAALFAEQARRTPDATAVRFEGASLSYSECDVRARRLAAELRSLGVGPESIVAVRMHRGIDLPVALLAVVKAGAAYLPLDPSYPASRIEYLLADSRAGVLLTDSPAGESAIPCIDVVSFLAEAGFDAEVDAEVDELACVAPHPDNPAYLIYTSGSTGRPKGVLVSHRSIVNRLLWMQQAYQLDHTDRVLQKTPYSFDVSVWEFFWPLVTGACLVMARPDGHRDPAYLAEVIAAEQVTTLHFVPSMLRAFLAEPLAGLASVRRLICSGEALSADLVTAVAERIGCELHNLYGPTEAAVDVTAIRCSAGEKVTIGRPIANTRTYIVDRQLRPVPVGVPGELMLAGVQLARGYFGKPALTADRFIPDPFAGEPGRRLYRTGDRARYLADGTIEYLGRLDHQVKIRGHRIELGEVEAVLNEHPSVAAAAVAVHDQQLVGYLTGDALQLAAVQDYLRERLPEAMMPSRWVVLDELPLTSSGKVERKALPRPESERPELADSYVAPRTPVEELIAEAFGTALELARVGVEDRFSDLGGDSIRAIRAVGALRAQGLDLSVLDLLTHQTPARLAGLESATPSAALTEEWVRPWQLIGDQDRALLGADIVDAYPIGQLQAGMLYEMAAGQHGNTYQNVTGFSMIDDASFSLAALQAAAEVLVDRHEVLRTSFHLTGFSEPMQLVHAQAPIEVGCTDLQHLSAAEQQATLEAFWEEAKRQPLELEHAPLIRWHVHLTGERAWTLTHVESHAVLDGWSHHSVIAELRASYRSIRDGQGTGLTPLPPVRFADFIQLEKQALASDVDREFWRDRLQRFGRLELPMSLVRSTGQQAGDSPAKHPEVHVSWSDLAPRLRRLAAESQTSLKTVLYAAHLTVLGAITGQRRFHTGVVSNGRPESLGSDLVRGMFLNTLPFAVDLAQPSWRSLLRAVHAEELAQWPHRRYPLPAMQREWGEERPLLPAIFGYLDFHVLAEEEASMGDITDDSPNEFTLDVWTFPGQWRLACHPDWADQERLEAIAAAHLDVLRAMVADIEADPTSLLLPSLTEPEQGLPSADSLPECGVPELVAAQVLNRPDAIAVQFGQDQLSYAELDRRANQLAHWLIARGVRPETPVAVRMQRSLELPVALLGILKAGGYYVPLDPQHPDERSRFALEDSAAQLLVTQPDFAGAFSELDKIELEPTWAQLAGQPDVPPAVRIEPDNASAVLYTSGSTGRPKGIALSHRNMVRLVHHSNWTDLDEHQVFLLVSPMAFDAFTLELWGSLCNGARLAVAPPETPTADVLQQLLTDHQVTCLVLTAGLFQHIAETRPTALKGLRHLVSGGDVLSPTHVRTLLELGVAVSNGYGPTECTTFSTIAHLSLADTQAALPIGAPLTNTYVRVVDDQLRPLPVGVPGELLVGGPGVTRGYLNRPDLTAERFVPDPLATQPGARVYRTGDIGWRDLDQVLHFVGRRDGQFKIRGNRIELGEVEAIIQQLPGVGSAAAGVHQDPNGNKMLVGYVVPRADSDEPLADVTQLGELMRRTVPDSLIPTAWVVMTELPLTPNGKVDRNALPAPAAITASADYLAPRNATEQAIADAWAQALRIEKVGVHDDFYALGGHSLLVLRIVSELKERHGYQLSVRSFNQHRTVEALAAVLQAEEDSTEAMVWLRRHGSQVPLFCVHPGGGSAHWYRPLAEYLDPELPVAAFGWPGLQGNRDSVPTTEQMAARYLAELRAAAPHGPYRLFSWCGGSGIASEMAHTLRAAGESVTFILLDPGLDGHQRPELWKEYRLIQRCVDVLELLRDAPASMDTTELRDEAFRLLEHLVDDVDPAIGIQLPERGAGEMWLPEAKMWEEVMLMVLSYRHRRYDGTVHLIISDELADGAHEVASGQTYEQYLAGWREAAEEVSVHRMPGDHFSVVRPPHVAELAGLISGLLDGAR